MVNLIIERGVIAMSDNKMKNTPENRKENGKFKKKNIKHNPSSESTRAVFNKPSIYEEID